MRKGLIVCVIMGALIFALNGTANAIVVTFDFEGTAANPLPPGDASESSHMTMPVLIEAYMEEVYGSDITVGGYVDVGAGSYSGWYWGAFPTAYLGPDQFLRNRGYWATPNHPPRWFSISFNEVPITSVKFDWGVSEDYIKAYADDVLYFFDSRWKGCGTAGTFYFSSPVTTLKFSDDAYTRGEIQIDNLEVTPIPEPATMLLLGSGLLGFALLGAKRRGIR